jgi:hypothetical protein
MSATTAAKTVVSPPASAIPCVITDTMRYTESESKSVAPWLKRIQIGTSAYFATDTNGRQ